LRRFYRALGVFVGGQETPGGVLAVDEQEGTVEVLVTQGRFRKREVVVARGRLDQVKALPSNGSVKVGEALVRLSPVDAGLLLSLLVGPKRAKLLADIGRAAGTLLETRGEAVESAADLKSHPRDALFRERELRGPVSAAAGLGRESGASPGLGPLKELLEGGGLAPSGANRVWAAVYAMEVLQDSVASGSEADIAGAYGLLDSVSSGGHPSPAEAVALGVVKATRRLHPAVFAKLTLQEGDWAP
jgi:hypothetical protein